MIRKQLYLEEDQDQALQRKAGELGVSEAEVVRRALAAALGRGSAPTELARKALEAFFANTESMLSQVEEVPEYKFDRNQIYEEDARFKRWGNDT